MTGCSETPKFGIKNTTKSLANIKLSKKEEEAKLKRSKQAEAKLLIQEFLVKRQQEVQQLRAQNQGALAGMEKRNQIKSSVN